MIDINNGRYWDEGIKLVSGCTRCSPGCERCWSLAMEHRLKTYQKEVKGHPEYMNRLKTKRPTVFAVWNDLYHENVSEEFILNFYGYSSYFPQHTILVLTKRPQRIAEIAGRLNINHVWHGITVCNQAEADEKIPIFLQVPGKKFLSIEPMLSLINLNLDWQNDLARWDSTGRDLPLHKIDAIILGGETGPGARPLHPDWVRSVRDQCAAAGVPFFFKQWGEWWGDRKLTTRTKQSVIMGDTVMHRVGRKNAGRELDGRTHDELPWVKA